MLVSQVFRDVPSLPDYFANESGRQHLVEAIGTGVPLTQASVSATLKELAMFFKQDAQINVAAELNATTFQKEPTELQRVPFDHRIPIHFAWNIKPLEEREQDLTVRLFLEGIPLNGIEPQRISIYVGVVHKYVGVRMFSYGTPIAIYATLYAMLTFILGGLVTWGVPRAYGGVVAGSL